MKKIFFVSLNKEKGRFHCNGVQKLSNRTEEARRTFASSRNYWKKNVRLWIRAHEKRLVRQIDALFTISKLTTNALAVLGGNWPAGK